MKDSQRLSANRKSSSAESSSRNHSFPAHENRRYTGISKQHKQQILTKKTSKDDGAAAAALGRQVTTSLSVPNNHDEIQFERQTNPHLKKFSSLPEDMPMRDFLKKCLKETVSGDYLCLNCCLNLNRSI